VSNKKHELMDLIKQKGSVVSDKEILLSSGERTHFYYDVKEVALDPKGANLYGEFLLEQVKKLGEKSVGCLEIGAVPRTTAILMKSDRKNELTGFVVRKKTEGHGLENIIEGDLAEPAVIVEGCCN
jgi:orotate phosphoribosyltransferase